MENSNDIRYQLAVKKVKRLKGFYTHLLVFVIVNLFLLLGKYQEWKSEESFFQLSNFATLVFWGIGVVAHAASVFLPSIVLGADWEERKIRELMDQDHSKKWE